MLSKDRLFPDVLSEQHQSLEDGETGGFFTPRIGPPTPKEA